MATSLRVVWDGTRNGPGGGHLSDYSLPEWPTPETAQERRRRPPWVRAGLTARPTIEGCQWPVLALLSALVLAR